MKNRLGLRDQTALTNFENFSLFLRSDEPLPGGRLTVSHYQAIHRHLFGDVYRWAGRVRTVRIAKGGNAFCFPEHIKSSMRTLFDRLHEEGQFKTLSADRFAGRSAAFLAELNAIHPFREGNGRTQMIFLNLVATRAGHPMDLGRLAPDPFLDAMIRSFHGDEAPLAAQLRGLIAP